MSIGPVSIGLALLASMGGVSNMFMTMGGILIILI